MPAFACYHGDCDDLAWHVGDGVSFVAIDALGRNWLCVNTGLAAIGGDDFPDSVKELIDARLRRHTRGWSREGTRKMLVLRNDEDGVREELVRATYPPAEESEARLHRAGWGLLSFVDRLGGPCILIITNGRRAVRASGRTADETWHSAAQKALDPEEKQPMTTAADAIIVPLYKDEHGAVRVGQSRVLLDVVIDEYHRGADPESIVRAYPTLALADVYAVIAYYLQHRDEVDGYIMKGREEAARLRLEIESKQPGRDQLREKLLARKAKMERAHASAGE